MTEHELAQEAMSAKLDGVISPAEEARLEAHLTACPDCAALFETMREMQGLFALDYEPPEELVPAVMEKIREDAPAKKRGKVLWLRWASLAAALALVTFAGLRLMRDGGLTGGFSESAEFTAPMAAAPAEESVLFSEEAEALPEAGLKMSLMTAPAENGAPLEDALRALETAPEAAEEPADFNSDTNLSADVPGPEPKQEAEHASAE
ncbi:MAG: zf-HC2 domain-containing protein, partial [bacterium]